MRIMSHIFLPLVIMFSLLFLVSSCQDEPLRPDPIDFDRPSIVSVKADVERPAPGESVTLTVTTEGAVTSYSWTADEGSFTDATANPTTWIAPDAAGFYNVTCKVSNSSGSRSSTLSIQVKEEATGLGDAYWPFDLDFKDNAGANHGTGDETVLISSEEFFEGIGSAQFTSEDETVAGQLFAGTELGMGADDEFTVSLWIKTTDEDGYLFGKTSPEGLYVEGANCIWIGGGNVNVDISWVDGAGGDIAVNDDVWHHVVYRKSGLQVNTFIDGVIDIDNEFGDWSDDTDFQITMGAGWEEPGEEWWPNNYQGYMDEVQFFQEALSDEDVVALYTNQKAHWTFDSDFMDVLGSNHGEGDETISISNDVFIEGSGSALFESEDETVAGQLFAGTDLGMGADFNFTVTLWIKTTDEDGYLFGKTSPEEGLYVEGANCIWIGEGNVNVDISWVDGAGGGIAVNDDQWHHVAYVKSGLHVTTYIDGVVDIDTDFGDWSDDTDFQITMGAGWEEPGEEWWPNNYQGYMDDVRFFQRALPASAIMAIYEENAP